MRSMDFFQYCSKKVNGTYGFLIIREHFFGDFPNSKQLKKHGFFFFSSSFFLFQIFKLDTVRYRQLLSINGLINLTNLFLKTEHTP